MSVSPARSWNVDRLFNSDQGHAIPWGMSDDQTTVHDFAVRRSDWKQAGFFERSIETQHEGQVLFRIDRYALTSNNVSYATAGDALGYWKFFPAEEGWGRLPCFAFADVERSNHPAVKQGDRYFGYFPMSTHLLVQAERVRDDSLLDGSEHRRPLPAAYNRYTRVSEDPFYREKHEDAQMLLQPLFMTSFLVDDFLADNEFFGARTTIVTSASSKTSIALAFQLGQRSLDTVVGLTSDRNRSFVESLGFYDTVVTYDDLESLDANVPAVVVDMAGNREVSRRLHEHFSVNMKYDCIVGATHWDQGGPMRDLPGAKPQFFFAPTQIKKRSDDWGRAALMERIGRAWIPFVATTDQWLKIVRKYGHKAVASTYEDLVAGKCVPNEGQVLSLWDAPP